MEVDISHKDKDGRVILFQQVGKPPMVEYSKDPKQYTNWLGAFDQIYIEATEKAIKRFEDKKSDWATITGLYDHTGWDKEIYTCVKCVAFGKEVGTHVDDYFPGLVDKVFLVNGKSASALLSISPSIYYCLFILFGTAVTPEYELFLNLIKLVFNKETRERLRVLGGEKSKWLPEVSKYIDADVINKLVK